MVVLRFVNEEALMIGQEALAWGQWSMAEFGKNLARLRKARKLTQIQLADLIDVQPRLISRWETGETKPQFDHVVRLAEVLEVSLDVLMRGEDGVASTTFDIGNKRLKELCRQVDRLPAEDQAVICHVMDSLIRKEQVKAALSGPLPQG
jgi:transcriptional regulator with XRE-family HTH domain